MSHAPGLSRRHFLQSSTALTGGLALAGAAGALNSLAHQAVAAESGNELYKISLAQWSLHREYQSKKRDALNFAVDSKKEFGIEAVEYVNQFFMDKAEDQTYLAELNKRAADHGVKNVLIMIDGEGRLGDPDEAARAKAVDNHKKWVTAAKTLGCHSIRVNAASEGTYADQLKLAADGLHRLSEFAAPMGLGVIVENHGGLSSNGSWLAGVMHAVNLPNCGTLPDFGNFRVGGKIDFDRYRGVELLMPFAKAVSAKSHEFDKAGNEVHTDYRRMMNIVLSFGYNGFVGIEYEGDGLPEAEGILATKRLLERVRTELS